MFNAIPDLTERDLERFWKYVNKDSETIRSVENPDLYSHVVGNCWEWTSTIRSKKEPYGRLEINKINYDAHRVAYKIQYGKDPGDLLVCHHCDNPRCIRSEHIYLGDRLQNSKDRKNRNRVNPNPVKGEAHYLSFFTESQVVEIFNRYHNEDITCQILADEYKCSPSLISRILSGENWGHLGLVKEKSDNRRRGDRVTSAKLTSGQVKDIFIRRVVDRESGPKLAKEFGVYVSTIYAIEHKRKWKSVTDLIAI